MEVILNLTLLYLVLVEAAAPGAHLRLSELGIGGSAARGEQLQPHWELPRDTMVRKYSF